jgi:hypothetical protein
MNTTSSIGVKSISSVSSPMIALRLRTWVSLFSVMFRV